MNVRLILVSSAVLGLLAGDAAAQKLSLRIEQGVVTLDAENVTVDEVLARWSQATGLNVVSKSGQGSDIPVSLRLDGVPEREALRMVLRDLSGYIMGERRDPRTGVVTIDRLMILPQSAAQASPGAVAAPRRAPARAVTALTPPVIESPPIDETPVELAPQVEERPSGVRIGPAAAISGGSDAGVAGDGGARFELQQGGLIGADGNVNTGAPAAATTAPTAPDTAARPGVIVRPAAPTGEVRTTPRIAPDPAAQ
jgi:hypothetical protein